MSLTPDAHELEINTSDNVHFAPLIDEGADTEDFAPNTYIGGRRKRKLWPLVITVVILAALAGGGVFAYMQFTKTAPVTYTQTAAATGNLAVTVSATGPVQAAAVYNMNFSASGQIQSIYVHVGQQVKQGQKLATLSSTSLQDAVNQAQQSLNSANTSVGTAETSLINTRNQQSDAINIAYINEQNALNACTPTTSSGATPTPTPNPTTVANCKQLAEDQYYQAVAQSNTSITSAANQVTSAANQVSSAQASLQTAQDNLAAATLTAPHSGTIVAINGVVGQTAGSATSSSSSTSSSAFIVLVNSSGLSLTAQVNEANIASVQIGQTARFTVAAYPSLTFRATVTGIDTLGQTTSNVVTYPVSLSVDMLSVGNAHVYPGMTATINITTAERIGTLLIPSAALSFSSTALQNGELTRSQLTGLISGSSSSASGAQGSRGIVVELQNGKLVPVLVTTGLTNGQYTEILSGLKEGEQVVVSQSGGLTTTTSAGTGTGAGGGLGGGGGRFSGAGLGGG